MSTIQRSEDLRIWQQVREMCQWYFALVKNSELKKDFFLKDHASRSIGSVMDNIAEGFERSGNREFIQFLAIAKGSAGEYRSQLYRLYDAGYINEETINNKVSEVRTLSEGIGSFMSYLNKSKIKGSKFKEG